MKTRKRSKFSCCLYTSVFTLLLLLLVLPGCERKSPPQKAAEEAKPAAIKPEAIMPVEINQKETRLTIIPEDYEQWSDISFSADGRQVFYQAGKYGREFIAAASTNGENIGPDYDGVSFLVMSPDGRRFAFGGRKGGKKRLVVDNKELTYLYHEEVAPANFSPDGRLIACEVGGLSKKKWFIVVSDGEKEVYRSNVYPDTFRQPLFSPDSRVLVYELGEKDKNRIVFFLDLNFKKLIKERRYTGSEEPVRFFFSSDSSRVIYEVKKEGKRFLVLQDFTLNVERKVEIPYTFTAQFALSPDGNKIIYIATKEGKHFLVVSTWESPAQGKEIGPYDGISKVVFSPDQTMLAYLAMKGGKWRSVVGDKEGPANYNGAGDAPVFSPDGAKIAYPAVKGGFQDERMTDAKWVMVVSRAGNPAAVKEGPVYDRAITPVFSPDGRSIAYRARKGPMENAKRFVVIADSATGKVIKEGPLGDEIWPPVWSADGKFVGYGARIGRELWWKVQSLP